MTGPCMEDLRSVFGAVRSDVSAVTSLMGIRLIDTTIAAHLDRLAVPD